MNVAIVGSRDYSSPEAVEKYVNFLSDDVCIVSGGARGVDTIAEKAAIKRGLKTLIFRADWDKYGRNAGYLRNIEIVKNADRVVAFWDGKSRGTKHTIDLANKLGKQVEIL